MCLSRKAARPPHVSADIQVEGGGEHRSHDQRVQQDPQRHRTRSRRTPPLAINTERHRWPSTPRTAPAYRSVLSSTTCTTPQIRTVLRRPIELAMDFRAPEGAPDTIVDPGGPQAPAVLPLRRPSPVTTRVTRAGSAATAVSLAEVSHHRLTGTVRRGPLSPSGEEQDRLRPGIKHQMTRIRWGSLKEAQGPGRPCDSRGVSRR